MARTNHSPRPGSGNAGLLPLPAGSLWSWGGCGGAAAPSGPSVTGLLSGSLTCRPGAATAHTCVPGPRTGRWGRKTLESGSGRPGPGPARRVTGALGDAAGPPQPCACSPAPYSEPGPRRSPSRRGRESAPTKPGAPSPEDAPAPVHSPARPTRLRAWPHGRLKVFLSCCPVISAGL